MKKLDLSGQRFGRLVAYEINGKNKWGNYIWKCKCSCGNICFVPSGDLMTSHSLSCGCLRKEYLESAKKHGFASKRNPLKHRFFNLYLKIRSRCEDSSNKSFKDYGDRGIKCLWQSFEDFRDDMYKSYQSHIKEFGDKNTSIDRIDNNGHYCKENCRWATRKEQNNNKRSNHKIEFRGRIQNLSQWSREIGIKAPTIRRRLKVSKWSIEKALTNRICQNQFS